MATIKTHSPYLRDIHLANLIAGAKLTETDGFPIIENWMVATEPPKEIIQWDRRYDIKNPNNTSICFYCCDHTFQSVLNNPEKYVEQFKKYESIIGLDASPYDNMPICIQKSQIFINLACTYYYGAQGIKIIPNIRVGDDRTLSSLDAYPKHSLIAIGTHGFIGQLNNRRIFAEQVQTIIEKLEPSGICVYGKAINDIFWIARFMGIKIYQFDSYTMKENAKDRLKKHSEGNINER